MKDLIINGSPRKESNTQIALDEMIGVFELRRAPIRPIRKRRFCSIIREKSLGKKAL